ncbi:hypothetical protein [Pedobacter duraquae]|uniref:MG2 domain-containing protein n=1 Tax=Pedobacter duraquae TaxID=425511 RepID=A0A4R6IQY6_9SPHI|nr:hypothetical protein [Pedobacter duraquae]TDO24627.1 hypothetical protein CLV32_0917 [Pedobacter duraquae]
MSLHARRISIGFIFLLLFALQTVAQIETTREKIFVHFDKTTYTNTELVWFTGYLTGASADRAVRHEVLSLALIRDVDSVVIKQDKYLMENGLTMGCMLLPDSLIAGNYHFLATTNLVKAGIPDVVFIQPILIKTNLDPPFNASIKFMNQEKSANIHELLLAVTTKDARFLPGPVDVAYKYGKLLKKTKTNVSGELLFTVREQPDITDPNLYAKLSFGKDSSFVNIPLPVSIKKAKVNFYPEGGHLVDQISGRIAWEVKDQQSATVTVKAQLFQDHKVIDTIETNAYGIGKFILTPNKNSTYSVKLMHSGFADSIYQLPPILKNGLGISIAKAAVKDTLQVIIRSSMPQQIRLHIGDANQSYPATEIRINEGRKLIKFPLDGVPKGLHTITFSDSLGRPLAERMFFAKYDPVKNLEIRTDKQSYATRQKVTLKLNLVGADTVGLVSIACVQDNRISSKMANDIESYTYLNSELTNLPLAVNGRGIEDRQYMEDILLTRGWRKYLWLEKNKSDVKEDDSLNFKIVIKRAGKKLKKPVSISYFNDKGVGILSTNSDGEVTLTTDALLTEFGKKFSLLAGNAADPDYQIEIKDPYVANNGRYAKLYNVEQRLIPTAVQNNSVLAINSKEKVNRLQEVVIKKSNDQSINFQERARGTNACGDYVCTSNILNCPNHFGSSGNTQPVTGKQYRNPQTQSFSIYNGCTIVTKKVKITNLDPIYTQKAYYVNDFADPQESAFVSTIYWDHARVVKLQPQEITFFTSDITGKFRVVVQGLSNNDVLYGQYDFEVKNK